MIDREQLKLALKAFRKRLKLMRQDEESSLSHGAMTMGKKSAIVGIKPPDTFPKEVWEELAREGRLKDMGRGAYALPEDVN